MYDDIVSAGRGFRLYALLNPSRENQETSLSTRVLDRRAHELIDEFFQDHLARDCLRDFDNSSEIQEFDRRHDRARWAGTRLSAGMAAAMCMEATASLWMNPPTLRVSPNYCVASTVSLSPIALVTATSVDRRGLPCSDRAR